MKLMFIVLITLLIVQMCNAQGADEYAEKRKTEKWLRDKRIPLRYLQSYNGYIVHYNCDSIPFLKKCVGDTIKIGTAIGTFAIDVAHLDKYISNEQFGKTQYVQDILNDGRVTLTGMHETVFIYKRDSLWEIESGYEDKGPKLIFHPKMFAGGKASVKLSRKYNYLQDQIVLERTWVEDGKKCYTIRINNKEDGEETSYAYTFDENLHFLYWEDCKIKSNSRSANDLNRKDL